MTFKAISSLLQPTGNSLLAGDGDQTLYGFVLHIFRFIILCIIGIVFGSLLRKFDKVNAKLSFSPNIAT